MDDQSYSILYTDRVGSLLPRPHRDALLSSSTCRRWISVLWLASPKMSCCLLSQAGQHWRHGWGWHGRSGSPENLSVVSAQTAQQKTHHTASVN